MSKIMKGGAKEESFSPTTVGSLPIKTLRRREEAERGRSGPTAESTSMSSKRGAGSDLNRDNWEAQMDNEGPTEMGTWQKADEVQRTLPCSTPPDVPC